MVSPLGTPKSINRIQQSDLQSFYDTHYTPANMSVVSVGSLPIDSVVNLLSRSPFGESIKSRRTAPQTSIVNLPTPLESKYVFELSKCISSDNLPKAFSYLTTCLLPAHIKDTAINLLDDILEEILTHELRLKRSWTYHVGIHHTHYRCVRQFSINSESLALSALDDIDAVVDQAIQSLSQYEEEFERMRQERLTRIAMIDISGRKLVDEVLNQLSVNNFIFSLKKDKEEMENVTWEEVQALAQWLQPERRWTRIVCP